MTEKQLPHGGDNEEEQEPEYLGHKESKLLNLWSDQGQLINQALSPTGLPKKPKWAKKLPVNKIQKQKEQIHESAKNSTLTNQQSEVSQKKQEFGSQQALINQKGQEITQTPQHFGEIPQDFTNERNHVLDTFRQRQDEINQKQQQITEASQLFDNFWNNQ